MSQRSFSYKLQYLQKERERESEKPSVRLSSIHILIENRAECISKFFRLIDFVFVSFFCCFLLWFFFCERKIYNRLIGTELTDETKIILKRANCRTCLSRMDRRKNIYIYLCAAIICDVMWFYYGNI